MDQDFLNKIKNLTPVIQDLSTYMDADEEMSVIAEYIVKHNQHAEYVDVSRIKFLYAPKPKKDGSRFVIHELFKRSEMDKMINDEFDFIITLFYDVWVKLDGETKIIALDKALCGVDVDVHNDKSAEVKTKKKSPDSKEYVANMLLYGPERVMRISETIDLTCQTAIEERKAREKSKKADPELD